ncbi:hypothetical protein SLEP1_g3791 [Rubroshorea leprosula]|uniref:Uncharacterized protein n=1 Tax=Rubroshorea leprosula TaxID=152421 RepID=A0AAV5HSE2_9ROSI|nr:hypothetical protein SLEP1_g3791 [Rubroshorea leprosula]
MPRKLHPQPAETHRPKGRGKESRSGNFYFKGRVLGPKISSLTRKEEKNSKLLLIPQERTVGSLGACRKEELGRRRR